MKRNEAVAGMFYEKDKSLLLKQIKSCFTAEKLYSKDRKSGKVFGIISPHAGYMYSGSCAAHGFNEIAESEVSDIYFLIGPNHYSDKSAFSCVDWKTPLGVLKCETEFVEKISKLTGISIDESVHKSEHSIEVQLPFLQYINKNLKKYFKIVCLSVSSDINIGKVSSAINEFISKNKKNVTFIISSDFTHFGNRFGYVPFFDDVKKNLKSLDYGAIDLILKKDAKNFNEYIEKTEATICGYIPILIFLNIIDKNVKGKLLSYYNSSEISKDEDNTVSYASIIFR